MIFAFKKTALLFLIPSAVFIAVSLWYILDSLVLNTGLGTADLIMLIISVVVLFVCSRLSLNMRTKLYNESVRLCDNDLDAFIAEQDRIFSKASGPNKSMIIMNKAFGLIAWEKLDEAEKILKEAGDMKQAKKSLHMQFLILSRKISIEYRKRNYDKVREYIECQSKLITDMKLDGTIFEKKYKIAVESNINKCKFLEELDKSDDSGKYAAKLFYETKQSLENLNEKSLFYIYSKINLEYTLGLLCYAMNDKSESERYFKLASEEKAAYPICSRLRKYLKDKDIRALINAND